MPWVHSPTGERHVGGGTRTELNGPPRSWQPWSQSPSSAATTAVVPIRKASTAQQRKASMDQPPCTLHYGRAHVRQPSRGRFRECLERFGEKGTRADPLSHVNERVRVRSRSDRCSVASGGHFARAHAVLDAAVRGAP